MKDIIEIFIRDPGLAYHISSKIPFPYRFELEGRGSPGFKRRGDYQGIIELDKPDKELLKMPLSEALLKRRSIRRYRSKSIDFKVFSTFIYFVAAVQGYKYGYPLRTYPTAGALNSPEVFIHIDNVELIDKGIYHYNPFSHSLELIRSGDFKYEVYKASLEQSQVLESAFNILVVGVYDRTYSKYGLRAYRYVLEDVGHIGQNIYLVATALNLATVCMGAFIDDELSTIFQLNDGEFPLLLYSVGYPVSP
ncbi:MAG TPA: SagB/ThcOx family dehydrogenase [Thermoprotei archaeon]|nr:SagB/ThcOx family dehydrogenase [Thermoprotei archaeon]